jgi:hypothetical protein
MVGQCYILVVIHTKIMLVYIGLDEKGFAKPYRLKNSSNVPFLSHAANHWLGFGDL